MELSEEVLHSALHIKAHEVHHHSLLRIRLVRVERVVSVGRQICDAQHSLLPPKHHARHDSLRPALSVLTDGLFLPLQNLEHRVHLRAQGSTQARATL
jgi:hypothetical protein